MIQLAIDDQSTTNACANGDADNVTRATRRTNPPFAVRCAVRVVVEGAGKFDGVRNEIAQRQIVPTKIWRNDHNAVFAIQWSGRTNSNTQNVAAFRPCFLERLGNRDLDHFDHALHDTARAPFAARRCGSTLHGELTRSVGGHGANDDVGAAKVYADDVGVCVVCHVGG